MAIAWFEVRVFDTDTKHMKLPIEWAEDPRGWLGRLNSVVKKSAAQLAAEARYPLDEEDDWDDEEEEQAPLVVAQVEREHRPVRSWPPLREYEPEPVPSVIGGLIHPPAPLPAQWQPKQAHTVEESPVGKSVWEAMLEHRDELSPWMIELAEAKLRGDDPPYVGTYIDPREIADPGYLEDAAVEEDPDVTANQDGLVSSQPLRDELREGPPAPDHINPVPEVTDEEVAAELEHLKVDAKIEQLETEYRSWERNELSWLKQMIKDGYNPATHWKFKDLNDRQRAALGI